MAALVVVVHHCSLVAPQVAEAYREGGGEATAWGWWLLHSPANLLVANPGPVVVFFVLSGFVLTVAVDRPGVSWTSYLARRAVRLLLPLWAVVAVAAVLFGVVWPRSPVVGASWWVNAHSEAITPPALARHAFPLLPGEFWLVSPLWTLRWELLFSALLPLIVWVAARYRRWSPALLAFSVGVTLVGAAIGSSALTWMPVFLAGVALAVDRQRVQDAISMLAGYRRWVVAGLALVALNAEQWLPLPRAVAFACVVIGAIALLLVFLTPGLAWTRSSAVQWLGSRSFSLYLVHEVVLFVVLEVFGATAAVLLVLALTVPVSLLLADVFYRAVELPSILLARRLPSMPTPARAGSRAS